jgi:hypothetical protein
MAKIPNNNNAKPLRVAPASSLPVTHEEAAEKVANGLSTSCPSASASFASSHTPRSCSSAISPGSPLTPLGRGKKPNSPKLFTQSQYNRWGKKCAFDAVTVVVKLISTWPVHTEAFSDSTNPNEPPPSCSSRSSSSLSTGSTAAPASEPGSPGSTPNSAKPSPQATYSSSPKFPELLAKGAAATTATLAAGNPKAEAANEAADEAANALLELVGRVAPGLSDNMLKEIDAFKSAAVTQKQSDKLVIKMYKMWTNVFDRYELFGPMLKSEFKSDPTFDLFWQLAYHLVKIDRTPTTQEIKKSPFAHQTPMSDELKSIYQGHIVLQKTMQTAGFLSLGDRKCDTHIKWALSVSKLTMGALTQEKENILGLLYEKCDSLQQNSPNNPQESEKSQEINNIKKEINRINTVFESVSDKLSQSISFLVPAAFTADDVADNLSAEIPKPALDKLFNALKNISQLVFKPKEEQKKETERLLANIVLKCSDFVIDKTNPQIPDDTLQELEGAFKQYAKFYSVSLYFAFDTFMEAIDLINNGKNPNYFTEKLESPFKEEIQKSLESIFKSFGYAMLYNQSALQQHAELVKKTGHEGMHMSIMFSMSRCVAELLSHTFTGKSRYPNGEDGVIMRTTETERATTAERAGYEANKAATFERELDKLDHTNLIIFHILNFFETKNMKTEKENLNKLLTNQQLYKQGLQGRWTSSSYPAKILDSNGQIIDKKQIAEEIKCLIPDHYTGDVFDIMDRHLVTATNQDPTGIDRCYQVALFICYLFANKKL